MFIIGSTQSDIGYRLFVPKCIDVVAGSKRNIRNIRNRRMNC